jgi:nucleoid-associated protein Lsr2
MSIWNPRTGKSGNLAPSGKLTQFFYGGSSMAQRVQIILEDDFDGGTAEETVTFALDGAEYEIDLSAKNAAGLREALAPWVGRARKTGGRRKRGGAKPASDSSTSDIRAWAQVNGHEVSSRGRVSAEIREAYERAHQG